MSLSLQSVVAEDPNCLSYGDSLFPSSLLQNLEQMKRMQTMCDIILVANDMEVLAHKVVLAAASPYFQ